MANKVIFLMGATATGKTDLAVEIAKRFPVELISVDSALIYRGMDIGTAKPAAGALAITPHHLIDIIDPAERYSAWHFVEDANRLIDEISARGKIPLLVGGTMMYYHALEHGLNQLPVADTSVRASLNQQATQIGWQAMHAKLARIDPVSASRINPGDSQRIQRALEVFEISGLPLSSLQQHVSTGLKPETLKIILNAHDRAGLHARIDLRFMEMIEKGLIDEVRLLKNRSDLDLSLPSMRCVGYRQVWQFLDGSLSRDEMTYKAIVATRQLAKRQMTWLRKQPQEHAFDCLDYRKEAIFESINNVFSGAW
ncbi:MAG: tRNA (adenosine(37)-N6)-dimethylallyltransferase MiaA [Gammaproteobacteria bacterium]|nr:tRNA (adenosine(37)-N6)-dimethylallyltransferase MiaA [Gammaproteobacteria bacterium]